MKTLLVASAYLLYLSNVYGSSPCAVSCGTTSCGTPSNSSNQILDYYWRDYVGIIPPDAIPGGKDRAGNPTYIGQAYIRNFELLPGTIYSGCNTARVSAYGKEIKVDKNIKILCGHQLHKYAWIPVKNEETNLLTDCHFVIGGSEVGHTLTIGRVNHDGQVIIGKVFSYPLDNSGLWIPYNEAESRFQVYELLTYDCSHTGIDMQYAIDATPV